LWISRVELAYFQEFLVNFVVEDVRVASPWIYWVKASWRRRNTKLAQINASQKQIIIISFENG